MDAALSLANKQQPAAACLLQVCRPARLALPQRAGPLGAGRGRRRARRRGLLRAAGQRGRRAGRTLHVRAQVPQAEAFGELPHLRAAGALLPGAVHAHAHGYPSPGHPPAHLFACCLQT